MKNNIILKSILYVLQGALVGVGAILPGVSGGVLCVAFGVYEPMMELLTHPVKSLKKHYKLFLPFGIGWVVGFLVLAKGVEVLFAWYETAALMLFFGLIGGTLPELFRVSQKSGENKSWTPFVLSVSLAYLFFHILENGVSTVLAPSFWSFLLCGVLWGLSLIVPGFSSSSILIYFGLYEPMTAGIAALDWTVLVPMLLGIVVTALMFARLVHMLYQKHYAVTSRIVLGFVIASSLKVIPADFGGPVSLIISLVCFAAGFTAARAMDLAKAKQNH